MNVYRIEYLSSGGERVGYSYHSSKREAFAVAATWRRELGGGLREAKTDMETIKVERTRKSFLAVLNRYGGHADNG